jgi:hypothetical protein
MAGGCNGWNLELLLGNGLLFVGMVVSGLSVKMSRDE